MLLVWVVKGVHAGRFIQYPDDVAHKMVENGEAQWPNTCATKIQSPVYETREMVADKPKRKRGRPKKAKPEETPAAEPEPDADAD